MLRGVSTRVAVWLSDRGHDEKADHDTADGSP